MKKQNFSKIEENLLRWYTQNSRKLPWRRTTNTYHILVSEIMLQQTQVKRVIPFYTNWLRDFPTWAELAKASNQEVLRAWSGLGYNRRALILRDIARTIIQQHRAPRSVKEWIKLKGIGPYTAASVSLFSKQDRQIPIDTNVRRVLGRTLYGFAFPTHMQDTKLKPLAQKFLDTCKHPDDIVQAIFDLANTHCVKQPHCSKCPLAHLCKANSKFTTDFQKAPGRINPVSFEKKQKNKPYPDRIYRGKILRLVQRNSRGMLTEEIARAIDPSFRIEVDIQWMKNILNRLVQDRMLSNNGNRYFLSQDS